MHVCEVSGTDVQPILFIWGASCIAPYVVYTLLSTLLRMGTLSNITGTRVPGYGYPGTGTGTRVPGTRTRVQYPGTRVPAGTRSHPQGQEGRVERVTVARA